MEQLKNHEWVDYRKLEDELDWKKNENLKDSLLENVVENAVTGVGFMLGCVALIIVLVFFVF